jgi:CubicO group peptidase (beta-lactamase class C family)
MAFQLLGYINERITGESFEKSIQSKILKPLGLTETTVFAPKDASKGVIPVGQKASGWSAQFPGTEA